MTTDPSSQAAGSTTRVRVPDRAFKNLVSAIHGVMMQSCHSDILVCQCSRAESKKRAISRSLRRDILTEPFKAGKKRSPFTHKI